MAKTRTASMPGVKLAGEAWAAGCRDVQAAINWATARGEVAGRPFQAAFRQVLAGQDAAPPAVNPQVTPSGDLGADTGAGRVDRAGHSDPSPVKGPARARPKAARAGVGTNGQAGHPTLGPGPASEAGLPPAGTALTPAEFIADLKELRRLVTKYGKKGLADLVGLLGS